MGVVAKFFARALHATAKKPPIVNPGYTPEYSTSDKAGRG